MSEFDRFFDQLYRELGWLNNRCAYKGFQAPNTVEYPIDMYFDDSGYHIEVALVDRAIADVDITVEDNHIRVTTTDPKEVSQERKYVIRKIKQQGVDFQFLVPNKFDISKAKATMQNGLLCILAPTAEGKQPHKINING